MKIAIGVEVIELKGNNGNIHPTLIWDEDEAILVDVGYPGQLREVLAAMNKAGIPLHRLNKIIITHQDFDHIGGLKEMLTDHKIQVITLDEEKPYIEGEKPLIKMTPERLAKMFESLSAEQRSEAEERFLQSLRSNVQQAVIDGEVLPYCGGITVIHTPGHTPGHICLYLNRSKILIAGDALNVVDGELVGANPVHTLDMKQAKKSIGKLAKYDIETVICYHGGVFRDNVINRLQELANRNM
jgi:glyoxylase-like metal-dependent hydrolase (beta-lactamase superfamily II)